MAMGLLHGKLSKTKNIKLGTDSGEIAISNPNNINTGAVIFFEPGDVENAANWSAVKKLFVVGTGLLLVFNTTLGSALPSGGTDYLAAYFQVSSPEQIALPVTVFLIGYIFGPIIFSPLSETYGRRISLLPSFAVYTISSLACALAPNWPCLLLFRFIVGVGASAPPTVLGGVFADIYPDLIPRGKAVMLLALATNIGPITGPVISGFISARGWRWMFWMSVILTATTWPPLLFLPESYGPTILSRRAKAMHAATRNPDISAPAQLRRPSLKQIIITVLARPIRMLTEPIVLCTCLFLALQYAMFFLYFEAYPYIFHGIYGMSSGLASLAFIPIGIGAFLAMAIFLKYDGILRAAEERGAPWAASDEYRRLPLACVGGPLLAISQFWIGWTARAEVHWIVPMLSGIPYGIGIELTFMALTNYLTDAYDIFAASAMASSVFTRNILAALLLPLASHRMYKQLGVNWACTILGAICMVMAVIPFLFLRYGALLRARSSFCVHIQTNRQRGEAH